MQNMSAPWRVFSVQTSLKQREGITFIVHGNPMVSLENWYIEGFLMNSDRKSYPEWKTMSAIGRHDEEFP